MFNTRVPHLTGLIVANDYVKSFGASEIRVQKCFDICCRDLAVDGADKASFSVKIQISAALDLVQHALQQIRSAIPDNDAFENVLCEIGITAVDDQMYLEP